MIQTNRRRGHGTQTSSEGFTVESSMYHATFCTCIKTLGPPRRVRGLPSFIYMISVMPMSMCSFIFLPDTGFDQSARSLAAFYNTPPPTAGQVVCRHQKLPLSEATARRATAWRAKVAKRCLAQKTTKEETHRVEAGIAPSRPAAEQPVGQLRLTLPTLQTAKYLPSRK